MTNHADFPTRPTWLTRTVRAGTALVLSVGCFGAGWWTGARTTSDPVAHQVAADMQTCGAFQAIDHLADESKDPLSGPHGSTQTHDFIALSSAMNNARAAELSDSLDAAVTTYVYALANLGAVVNAREPIDDIESMRLIVNLSAHTVATVCQRPATDRTSGTADHGADEAATQTHRDVHGSQSTATDHP
ncbi:hypothetical protein LT337_32165 (plasmid) [Mycolicibacterium fortuitum]|nr:hypothetical protein LT337_32165 [Mycolicibacterium fortuitum]